MLPNARSLQQRFVLALCIVLITWTEGLRISRARIPTVYRKSFNCLNLHKSTRKRQPSYSYFSLSSPTSSSHTTSTCTTELSAVPEWLTESGIKQPSDEGVELMTVRFINTPNGKDVIAQVEPGANLLNVGDAAGVKLPRACRTGLCGSCTCEVKDPDAIVTDSNPREGYATIRACSSKCMVPAGMTEMIVDVGRMRRTKSAVRDGAKPGEIDDTLEVVDYSDPMSRFSGNWEKEFRPQWEIEKAKASGVGQVGGASDPKRRGSMCAKCAGAGRIPCYTCNGVGRVQMGDGKLSQCALCVGLRTVSCGYCRGKGSTLKKLNR